MNINDYSTKVKNLTDVFTSIGAPVDDEDLVAMTLNGFGKDYSQFCISIVVQETFFDFQDLITLLINEKMKIIGTSSNGGSQESVFYSNVKRGKSKGGKTSFRSRHGSHMVDIMNMKVNLMEVNKETLEEEEVMEVMVEVMELNNQITIQTTTIVPAISTQPCVVVLIFKSYIRNT